MIKHDEEKSNRIQEFKEILKNFKILNFCSPSSRKYENNINSLTLKSEYSDIDFLRESSDCSNNNFININYNISPNKQEDVNCNSKITNLKLSTIQSNDRKISTNDIADTNTETIETILHSLSKTKTEANLRFKNTKKEKLSKFNENSGYLSQDSETQGKHKSINNIQHLMGIKSVKQIKSINFDILSFKNKNSENVSKNNSNNPSPKKKLMLNINEALKALNSKQSSMETKNRIMSMTISNSAINIRLSENLKNKMINKDINEENNLFCDEMPNSKRKRKEDHEVNMSDLVKNNLYIDSSTNNLKLTSNSFLKSISPTSNNIIIH